MSSLAILHGYLLEGSGSNLWTRCVVEALCRKGHTVQLVCQEPHPDRYDCITAAYLHRLDGTVDTLFERDLAPGYTGRCIMHKPQLGDTLPVYVWDKYEEFPNAVPMIDLPDEEIELYLERNVRVVRRVVQEHDVIAMHANHAVLSSVVAQRVSEETGVPFAVMPHGSALEYAVKKDDRFLRLATDAFSAAERVFVHGEEMKRRVETILPDVVDLQGKFSVLPLGVHTWQFEPVPRERRREKVGRLLVSLHDKPRGRRPEQLDQMLARAYAASTPEELHRAFTSIQYDTKAPDADIEEKLSQLDWEHDAVLLYVGRLISAKGVQSGLAALPEIMAADSGVRLLLVGHGPLREPMELFVHALQHGDRHLAEQVVAHGRFLEGDPEGASASRELGKVRSYFDDLRSLGKLDAYFELARRHVRRDRVIFTGYLTHHELQHLFPCCDVGIFPSVVKEAGPLVFLEALASGCFPLGTYFAGMKASIDGIADMLPDEVVETMKLDPFNTTADIVRNVERALHIGVRYKDVLARTAQARFDWVSVGEKLARELKALAPAGASLSS
ncbi:MAG TPA: glycosyltransferase [Gemmatimonadaceae bacterium]|nr:glycosyltransferase [Gemmatimonadaceae bacterium]